MTEQETVEAILNALRPMVVDLVQQSQRLTRDAVPSAATRRSRHLTAQQVSLEHASRNGQQWTGAELEIVMRDDLSILELARMLKRSTHAVKSVRKARRRAAA